MINMVNSQVVLITGGNTGIGYETVKALYGSPVVYTILLGNRSLSNAKDAVSTLRSELPDAKVRDSNDPD